MSKCYLDLFTNLLSASRSIPSCFMKRKTWKCLEHNGMLEIYTRRCRELSAGPQPAGDWLIDWWLKGWFKMIDLITDYLIDYLECGKLWLVNWFVGLIWCNWLVIMMKLQWRHNERGYVSNHQRLDCLLNRLLRHKSKKTPKLPVTGLCEGTSPVTGEFPSQRPVKRKMFQSHDVIMA